MAETSVEPQRAPITIKDDQRKQLLYIFKISGMDTQQQEKLATDLKALFNMV